MNKVLCMDKGRVMIPRSYRRRQNLDDNSPLLCLETKSGAIVLRPVKASPERDIVDHLLGLKGLEIPERQHHCPPRT